MVRVLSWNLWWQFGPWEERRPAIEAEVELLAPDIALFQEVWSTETEDQAAMLGERTGMHVARTTEENGEPQSFGNAVLSRWPIEVLEVIRLPDENGDPSHRSALTASVATQAGDQVVVVTHLAWQYTAAALRLRQLQDVVDLVAKHHPEDPDAPPTILAGDFNAVPDSDEIRRLTGVAAPFNPDLVFTDCWAAVGDGPGYTWTRENPHAGDALWPRRRVDYVFVTWPRPKPLGNPLSARLVGVDAAHGIVPSDHYGVAVELDDRTSLEQEKPNGA